MGQTIQLGEVEMDVVQKDIKNLHLSVYPPNGRVRVSAPEHMSLDTIRVFVISKLGWIRQQQNKLREQERETPREYLDRESHYVWGKRYLLEVVKRSAAPSVQLNHQALTLQVRPGSDEAKKQAVLALWYREQVRQALPDPVARWEPLLGVEVSRFFVQHMKTKWGSCNPATGTIRLNTELAKKPRACLEYILVHEMVHLLEPTHNARFQKLMDNFMPLWRFQRDELNRVPLAHEEWSY
jgi:predicted metal-dependent hydrolase